MRLKKGLKVANRCKALFIFLWLFLLCFIFSVYALAKTIDFNDLTSIKKIGDIRLSPDGNLALLTIANVILKENRLKSDIWILSLKERTLKQLTVSSASDLDPKWSSNQGEVFFISKRSGSAQIWKAKIEDGTETKLTDFPTGIDSYTISKDNNFIVFSATTFPKCRGDIECISNYLRELEETDVKAKYINRLLYRHWDSWTFEKRKHLFSFNLKTKEIKDLDPRDIDVPPFSLFGNRDYDISPDGEKVCYVSNTDKDEALSTNNDLFIVPIDGGTPIRITKNRGSDFYPRYSPDGRFIAYLSQLTPGYESDRIRLVLYEIKTKKHYDLTKDFDFWVREFAFSPDGKAIYFTCHQDGYLPIYKIDIKEVVNNRAKITSILARSTNSKLNPLLDGTLLYGSEGLSYPLEVRLLKDGREIRLSYINDGLLANIDLSGVQDIRYKGFNDSPIQAWLLKPPNFNPKKTYPAIVMIHGGPQSVWSNAWSYRWNAQVFSARGYIVFLPNPRGSVGFGQDFINQVQGDWGGKVYQDMMKGVDYLASLPYVDKDRLGAIGGSYGGYMINWIEGHTNSFKALVSHAGVFNLDSMYGATEELWFPEWDLMGTPWTNPTMYERWSPHNFVNNFRTPCLVIHGELDYRVPVTEGMQLFTALKRMGVDSNFLYYPDEGHFILKPKNSKLWYEKVLNWFDHYLK